MLCLLLFVRAFGRLGLVSLTDVLGRTLAENVLERLLITLLELEIRLGLGLLDCCKFGATGPAAYANHQLLDTLLIVQESHGAGALPPCALTRVIARLMAMIQS